jgi:hypothetical protein
LCFANPERYKAAKATLPSFQERAFALYTLSPLPES